MPSGTVSERSHPVFEFVRALREPLTYQPWRNLYGAFGLLWGLPIPIFSVSIHCWATGHPFSLDFLARYPVHLLFAMHPLLFAVVFGAMGSVRARKDRHIGTLLASLQEKLEELREANEKLKELDRLRSEFVANVTHELKTPLVAIRGYAEMLQEGRLGPLTEKQATGLRTVLRNVDRQQQQIDDLLQIARLESGRLRADKHPFPLRPLLEGCVEMFRPQAEAKQIALGLDAPDVRVNADRDMIGHVVTNLIANAIKFVEPGGRVDVAVRNGDGVLVRVSDDGCGIPEEARPFIFDRFRQADGSMRRRHGGVGLGLAIVKGMLDQHGSSIEVTSEVGRGTTVEFDLPKGGDA